MAVATPRAGQLLGDSWRGEVTTRRAELRLAAACALPFEWLTATTTDERLDIGCSCSFRLDELVRDPRQPESLRRACGKSF